MFDLLNQFSFLHSVVEPNFDLEKLSTLTVVAEINKANANTSLCYAKAETSKQFLALNTLSLVEWVA